jgi:hypothetical protein
MLVALHITMLVPDLELPAQLSLITKEDPSKMAELMEKEGPSAVVLITEDRGHLDPLIDQL